jgi:glycosyltransferase involved in cell wall biosynthesis
MSKKILVVTDNRFWRSALGSQKRISSLLTYLHELNFEVHVVFAGMLYAEDEKCVERFEGIKIDALGSGRVPSFVEQPGPFERFKGVSKAVVKQCLVELERFARGDASISRLAPQHFYLSTKEHKLRDFRNEAVKRKFESVFYDFNPQIVIVEYVRLAWLLESLASDVREKCLIAVDTHDVQSERKKRFNAYSKSHDIDITEQEEARALSAADVVIAIQREDAAKLSAMVPGKKVVVAGYPFSAKERCGYGREGAATVRLGFVGSDMAPNVHALEFLVNDVLPQVRKAHGERVELHAFGGVCDALQRSQVWSKEGVFLHGYVQDIESIWSEVDIAVNPVCFGGGLKIKNIEALSFGVPLVTSSCGAEGLEHGAGEAFVVADTVDDLISALEELIGAPVLMQSLGKAAREFAADYFSAEAVYKDLVNEFLA